MSGNGKTTLLKLIVGELEPSEGDVRRSPHARFAKVDQHHADQIDLSLTPLQFMAQQYPGNGSNEHMQILRGHLSSCGVTSGSSNNKLVMDLQNTPSSALSGGQRSRVALASVSFSKVSGARVLCGRCHTISHHHLVTRFIIALTSNIHSLMFLFWMNRQTI